MEGPMFSSSLGAMRSLLGKLRSLLVSAEDQVPEPLNSQKDKLYLLKQDLEEINTFLMNLSWVEAPNMMVRHWMNEVRDLSYDIEDYIDKRMHHSSNSSEESRSERDLEVFNTLVKLANEALERHNRYDFGRWASNPRFVIHGGHGPVPWLDGDATNTVGIDDSMAELIKRLNIDAKQRLVVAIQGPVGVGKTTLAKQVYHEVEGQFECRAFVRASKMPDTRRLLGNIIFQIQGYHQRPTHGLPVQELIDILRTHLQRKRYLIVIDGLWETTSWDIVISAFPEDTHCSRILITTDIEEVALECCDYESDAIFKMEPLSGNYSTELFFNRLSGFPHEFSKQLKENSEEIIRACGGLPFAIISVASILAAQPANSEQWQHVEEALFSILRYNNLSSEVMLREIIGLSCNSLPHHLKTCLLYLSMYPEGSIFLKADLVKQWSAEGFIIAVEEKQCDEVAGCYFDELICRGLIQPNHANNSDEVILYTLHSTVFEVIRTMSIEKNFSTVIDYSNTISELSIKVRRLSLRFSSAKYATKPEGITLSPVRSLIFYGLVECLPSIMEFDVLRVLILEFWGDKEEVDLSGIDRLFQLRYMRITSNISVRLPARMIGLPYLQTVEIYARVTSIPSDIIHLPRLLHLCLHGEITLSDGIGHMRSLRTLQSFDLSSNSVDSIWQLGEMKDLRDLHVTSATEMSGPLKMKLIAFLSSFEKLGNLKSIILAPAPAASCRNIYLDCSCSTSPLSVFIQRLELLPPFCIFARLPVWIGQLRKLCILKIVLRELTTVDVDSIGQLQELTILSLYVRQPTAEQIIFHRAAFPVLKFFKFRCGIMRIAFQQEAMPRLRSLNLEFNAHSGEQNGNMVPGIEHLLNLQEITCRIGAAPGAEESDRIAVESVFNDVISKHSRLTNCNLRIVGLFDKEWHKTSELDRVAAVVEASQSNDASSTPNQVFSTPFQAISDTDRQSWDDGYNWHKYGQKEVKGSECSRSYYKCTFPSCPARKRVERSQDAQIIEIVYKGTHNHVRSPQLLQSGCSKAFEHTCGGMSSITTVVTSSFGSTGNSSSDEFDEQEVDSKTWIARFDDAPANSACSDEELDRHSLDGCTSELDEVAAVEEVSQSNDASSTAKLVLNTQFQAISDLDKQYWNDGYNWRKYGQKVVKGSEYPRSYYKCTFPSCPAKKVERLQDGQITEIVYKGTHNHARPQRTALELLQSRNASELSLGRMSGTPVATVEGLLTSIGDKDNNVGVASTSRRTENTGGNEFDEDEPDSKRRKDGDGEEISMSTDVSMLQHEVTTSLTVPLPELPPVPASAGGPAIPAAAATQPQPQPLPPLVELERVRCVGRGASGTVWMVRHHGTGHLYALKLLYESHDDAVRRQIMREIAILCTAEHPAVLRCHGVYDHGGQLLILLEYMDGGSLEGRHITAESFLADVARQVLSGIAYLHRHRIMHHDIRPSNLLIDLARHVKIANFGILGILNQTESCRSFVGTMAYKSPERIDNNLNDVCAGDIWSFGLSILELYLGRFPFGENLGRPGDWAALMCAIRYSDPPEPPRTASPEFRGFISCCLQKNPANRPTAAQLLEHPFCRRPAAPRCSSTVMTTVSDWE